MLRHVFPTNFSVAYFGIYDRLDSTGNETGSQLMQQWRYCRNSITHSGKKNGILIMDVFKITVESFVRNTIHFTFQ